MAADFYRSSHANHWLVDRKTLASARATDLKYASPQEIAWIAIWSANAIHKLAKRLNLRQQITATAIVYLRRFYLKNSYCETDIPLVAAACVYVAAKAEETAMHIKLIVTEARATFNEYGITSFPSDSAKLAEMEFYLIEDLEFHLIIYHPYRSLTHMTGRDTGPVAIRETMLEMDDNSMQMAWFVLNDTYRTELCLLYPPHIIAIASIYLAFALHAPAAIFQTQANNQNIMSAQQAAARSRASSLAGDGRPKLESNDSSTSINSPSHLHMQPTPTTPRNGSSNSSMAVQASQVSSAASQSSARSSGSAQSTRGKVDPITFLASLNVQLPIVLEVVQEVLSLYALWKSYEDTPGTGSGAGSSGGGSSTSGGSSGLAAGAPGERSQMDGTSHRPMTPTMLGLGLSNPGAAPGAGDERVIQILARMRRDREVDLAHPPHAGAAK